MFPAVTMQLLGIVALYGMLLMPMGAVIFVDFWLLPRLGLKSNFAESAGIPVNWAAALAWMLSLLICVVLIFGAGIRIFFVSLPGWFAAALLYLFLSFRIQRSATPGERGKAVQP